MSQDGAESYSRNFLNLNELRMYTLQSRHQGGKLKIKADKQAI